MSRKALASGVVSILALAAAGPLPAQERPPTAPGPATPAPPPGGIVAPERSYALGVAAGSLRWGDAAPYDDLALWGLSIERELWSPVRGRAGIASGTTTLATADGGVDTWVISFDLQVLVGADFGPFRAAGIVPYAVGGVGSLVTNPTGDGAGDLPTRSQSMWAWGGGVRARLAERWEARGEATRAGVRLADPSRPDEGETETIHNLRWEGSVQWLF